MSLKRSINQDGGSMKIGFIRVFVSNLKQSLDFYTNVLGMEIDYTDMEKWAQFKSGEDVSLAIEQCDASHGEEGSKLVGRFVGVTLMVDDISSVYDKLIGKGVLFASTPERQPWGGTLANLKDPDGNILTIMQEGS
jgi:lactoylglutathione lyase